MSKAHPPELKKYMDKRVTLKLNAGRKVTGILRGFDPFMNLVVDESFEERKDGEKLNIGMVVVRGTPSEEVLSIVGGFSRLKSVEAPFQYTS